MRKGNFREKVDEHLRQVGVVPPVAGEYRGLLIAAGIVRPGSRKKVGHVLLANNIEPGKHPRSETCLKLRGQFAPAHTPDDKEPWGVWALITTEDLESLVALSAISSLLNRSIISKSNNGGLLVTLNLIDPGVESGHVPSLNGMPLEACERFELPDRQQP
jgi:hypothetical protein